MIPLTKYYLAHQIKNHEMGLATSKKEPTRKTYAIGERILVKYILKEIGWDGVNWIDLAQDKAKSWVLLNAKMRVWVP
jgi:hypothetical protein